MQEIVVIDGEIELENTLDGEVELEAITDLDPEVVMSAGGGITPSGTISITENGVYNVTEYASADVDVQGGITPTGTKQISITANGTVTEDVTNYADVEVTTAVPASAVDTGTKSITTNGTHDVIGYASANVAVPASAVDSGTKSITSNGTHDVIGYASASVAVPNSYSASDEGKVVSNGALVAQTSDTVTENDTYDTTLIDELTVNVPTGGGSLPKTGTFTLAERSTTATFDIGMDSFNTILVVPLATTPLISGGKTLTFAIYNTEGYWSVICGTSNNAGSGSNAPSVGRNGLGSMATLSGTTVTIKSSGTAASGTINGGSFETVTYKWYAW